MAVKLHGIRGGSKAAWSPQTPRAPLPALGAIPLRGAAPSAPRRMQAPLTLGRVLYFVLLTGLICAGAYWLWLYLFFARAVGIVERDVDRLAPREAGRILRVAVQAGDTVRKGQPLVWLDYASAPRAEGTAGFISDQAARAGVERQRISDLQRRRHELSERSALLQAEIAALRARAQGLKRQYETLMRSQDAALRLQGLGAATVAEVLRLEQQTSLLDQEQAMALADARQKERAGRALDDEAAQLDRTLANLTETPSAIEDPGLITAPRDGVVAWVAHRAGEVVGPSEAVVLLRGGPLRVRAYVLPRDAHSLAQGRAVRVDLPTGESLRGVVARQHLLATSFEEGRAPAQRDPALADEPVMPFLLADIDLLDVPAEIAERLPVGAPCEVRGWRDWLRSLDAFTSWRRLR